MAFPSNCGQRNGSKYEYVLCYRFDIVANLFSLPDLSFNFESSEQNCTHFFWRLLFLLGKFGLVQLQILELEPHLSS